MKHVVSLAIAAMLAFTAVAAAGPAPAPAVRSITLPDASPDGVSMDYLAYDGRHHRVWVPAGNTGDVDVVDVKNDQVSKLAGFATSEIERQGRKRTVGPSSAVVGAGVVFVGNRGDSTVCALDAESLKKTGCVKLTSMPDALAYIASTREVWATTPRDKSIMILDVSDPAAIVVKTRLELEGQPEGVAVDAGRGLFHTNLEDLDRTLTIDVKSRKVLNTWPTGCGEDGPKGVALDHGSDFVIVACSDRVKVLAGASGKELSTIDTGGGVDDIAYVEKRRELYVGAAKAATLTVASIDARGKLATEAVVPTAAGARNAVVTDDGTAYLTDSREGKLLVVSPLSRR
jgi:hypothetical protein